MNQNQIDKFAFASLARDLPGGIALLAFCAFAVFGFAVAVGHMLS